MKYPGINKQPRREVNLPELSGGMNLRDSVSMIRDNQLTDSCNMWFKDGMLRTRPDTQTKLAKENIATDISSDISRVYYNSQFHPEIRNENKILASYTFYNKEGTRQYVYFWWHGDGKVVAELNTITLGWSRATEKIHKYFVVQHKGDVYVYFDNCLIYKLAEGTNEWKQVADEEITAPVVMAHCKPTNHSYSFTGTQINGYNLIGKYYKMIYSTINVEEDEHHMWYTLMWHLPAGESCVVKAILTTPWGNKVEHKVTWGGDYSQVYYETPTEADGRTKDKFYMFVGRYYIGFSITPGSDEYVKYFDTATEGLGWDDSVEYNYLTDNLEIIAPYKSEKGDKQKIFNMTQTEWFGGAAAGISGGTRLFLCGNTKASEKSLVAWSALNDPLYFPENNYFYVGDEREQVTAFGRQGENLVIFKPNETYYTYYAQNTNITAEHLINQSVVDYQANSVYFPLVTLNSKIGCAHPNTIVLCRNRLVWFNMDGRVYTLTSANQYSEMTIYPVSEMIEQRFPRSFNFGDGILGSLYSSLSNINDASAVDFNGHYVLFIGNKAFVMDYNCYGFSNVYSYSKTEDANALIPWYYWGFEALPNNNSIKFYEYDNEIYCGYRIRLSDEQDAICTLVIDAEGSVPTDSYYSSENGRIITVNKEINSFLQTKFFDFSASHYFKNVDRVSLMLGNNDGTPITVQFITDQGTESETLTLSDNETTPYTAGYVTVRNLSPCIRNILRFGVRLESKGLLAVDGINLLYRLLGGAK